MTKFGLHIDPDGAALRCHGAGLLDGERRIYEACETEAADARMLAYEGWCFWVPLCEAHLALYDADVASGLEAA